MRLTASSTKAKEIGLNQPLRPFASCPNGRLWQLSPEADM